MVERYTLADIPDRVGKTYTSPWITVDERRLDLFDESTFYERGEYEWDVDSFPNTMIEGFHLLGLLPYLANLTTRLHDSRAFSFNYGLDRVRFVSPVFAGQRLRARATVSDVREKNGGYLVLTDFTVEVEGNDKPGFVASMWALVLPRVPEGLVPRAEPETGA